MSTKVVSSTRTFFNVNNALKVFKTEDKTLIKIAKFILCPIKLIAALFIDFLNMGFSVLGIKPKIVFQDANENAKQTKDHEKTTNRKVKIILGAVLVGGHLFLKNMPDTMKSNLKEFIDQAEKDLQNTNNKLYLTGPSLALKIHRNEMMNYLMLTILSRYC